MLVNIAAQTLLDLTHATAVVDTGLPLMDAPAMVLFKSHSQLE